MDTKQAKLIGNILKLLIAVPGFIMFILILANQSDGAVDGSINLALIAFLACAILAIVFGIVYFFKNFGKSKGALFGLVGLGIIFAIGYAMSSGDVLPEWGTDGFEVTETVSKLSEMGVRGVLLLLVIAVVTAVFSEITSLIKR